MDLSPAVAVHLQQCNECSGPIIGTRFLCQNCSAGIMDSYDLCQGCKAKESVMKKHTAHLFEAFLSRDVRTVFLAGSHWQRELTREKRERERERERERGQREREREREIFAADVRSSHAERLPHWCGSLSLSLCISTASLSRSPSHIPLASYRFLVSKTFGLVDTDKDGVISLQDAQAFPDFFQFIRLPGAETEEPGTLSERVTIMVATSVALAGVKREEDNERQVVCDCV